MYVNIQDSALSADSLLVVLHMYYTICSRLILEYLILSQLHAVPTVGQEQIIQAVTIIFCTASTARRMNEVYQQLNFIFALSI